MAKKREVLEGILGYIRYFGFGTGLGLLVGWGLCVILVLAIIIS